MKIKRRKRHEKNQTKAIAIFVIITFILTLFPITILGADATSNLIGFQVEIKQDGNIIPELDWGTIDIEKEIEIGFTVRVPVERDIGSPGIDENKLIASGDTATFLIADGFEMTSSFTGPFDLSYETKRVGTLNIISGPEKTINAHILFDGDPEVFTGYGWSNVNITFNSIMKYDRTSNSDDGEDVIVSFLDKTFTLPVPPLPVVITGEKTGVRGGEFIDWKVKIEGNKGVTPVDIKGYIFKDDITNVGTYVPGTFMINTTDSNVGAILITPDFTAADTELSYIFPDPSLGEHFIFFRTEMKDDVFFSNGSKTIKNIGKILKDSDEVWSDDFNINFDVEWIEKTGAILDNVTGEIQWTITANQLSANLKNAIITDVLSNKLDFVSAEWSKFELGAWATPVPIIPNDGINGLESEYRLGDISTPVKVTIKTQIKTGIHNIGHEIQKIRNEATISWDDYSGPGAGVGSGSIAVKVGINPIEKKVGSTEYDTSTHTIPWNVKIVESDVDFKLRVMDLLVYGSSGFDVKGAYTIASNDTNTASLKHVSKKDFKKLTPNYNQKYKEGSCVSPDGLEVVVYKIKDAAMVDVADLILVTDVGGLGINLSGGAKGFSFESVITNPDIYAKNGNTEVSNYASLFSANASINESDDSIKYKSRMLVKDMLTVAAASDTNIKKNSASSDIDASFNYEDSTVVYRLHINANNITDLTNDITAIPGEKLGTITIVDTLPNGWEFIDIALDKEFMIYEGVGKANGKVTAGLELPKTTIVYDFNTLGEVTFTFSTLTKPYVILLKAKPNNTTLEGYFNANKTTTLKNVAKISAENWTIGASDFEDLKITSQILGKTLKIAGGILTWTVEYKPYNISHTGIKIEDKIPEGVELITDAEGILDLTNSNIVVTKLKLETNGTYTENGLVSLTLDVGGNISYDNLTRIMTFIIPSTETDQGYRLVYKTDVTGDAGTVIKNSVKLTESTLTSTPVIAGYTVKSADASATMTRNGWIEITKIDGSNGALLSGAAFDIKTEGGIIFRSGITGVDGKIILRGLPIGKYTLVETIAPAGFDIIAQVYQIEVIKVGDVLVTSINGKTGADSNKQIVENLKTGTLGSLKVSKKVAGNAFSNIKEFDFAITVPGISGNYDFIGHGGKSNGVIFFALDGTASIKLKGGEAISIIKLTKDSTYTVTEANYNSDGYVTTKTGDSGTIEADKTKEAVFTNTKNVDDNTDPRSPNNPGNPNNPGDQTNGDVLSDEIPGVTDSNGDTEDFIELDLDEIPLGAPLLPKTGIEESYLYLIGLMFIFAGLFIRKRI